LKHTFMLLLFVLWLYSTVKYLYRTQMEGVVELPNAPGFAKITREVETEIAHIYGDNINAAYFAQGYAHAQTRLWQMQMTRLAFQGRISEFFGAKALNMDKFMLAMEFYELAQQSE